MKNKQKKVKNQEGKVKTKIIKNMEKFSKIKKKENNK